MHDPFRHRETLLWAQPDRVTAFYLDHELAVENQKELILVVVLVPMKLTLQHTKPNHGVIDGCKRLVEPRLVSRCLPSEIDERKLPLLVVKLDVVVAHALPGARLRRDPGASYPFAAALDAPSTAVAFHALGQSLQRPNAGSPTALE